MVFHETENPLFKEYVPEESSLSPDSYGNNVFKKKKEEKLNEN